jgi:hypothetical protein
VVYAGMLWVRGPAVLMGGGCEFQPLEATCTGAGCWSLVSPSERRHRWRGRDSGSTRSRRSRVGAAGLGFLAGAAAGLAVAYFVDQSRSSGEGRLENYIAIPLALGTVSFMTVFVAMGE